MRPVSICKRDCFPNQQHSPYTPKTRFYLFLDCCERGLGTRVDRKLGIVEHDAGGRLVHRFLKLILKLFIFNLLILDMFYLKLNSNIGS